MDLFVRLRDFYIHLIYALPDTLTSCILRTGIMLVLIIASLIAAWIYLPWKATFLQVCTAFIAFTISLYINVDGFREAGEGFLAFTVSMSLLCIIFLPNFIPFWITPKPINQLKIKRIIRYFIWIILFLQMIVR